MFCNFFYVILLAISIGFMIGNRDIASDEWPVPDNVVLHNVIPFDSDNQLYKIFAEKETDILKMMYGSGDETLDADGMGLGNLQVMQYISGCAPYAVLKTTTKSIEAGEGNVGKVLTEADAAATTLTLVKKIDNLQANEHLAIYTAEPQHKLEFVKVIAGQGGTSLTIERNQDLTSAGLDSDRGSGYKVPKDTVVYRVSGNKNYKQPYELNALPAKGAPFKTAFENAVTDAAPASTSLCKCLNDASLVYEKYNDASTKPDVVGYFNQINETSNVLLGNTLLSSHDTRGIRKKSLQTAAIQQFINDLDTKKGHKFKIRAVDSCLATHVPEYTVKYKGVIDTRHISDNGQYFMYLGILTVLINMLYFYNPKIGQLVVKHEEGDGYTETAKKTIQNAPYNIRKAQAENWFVRIALLAISVLSAFFIYFNYAWDYHAQGCKDRRHNDHTQNDVKGRCEQQRDLLNNRQWTYDDPYLVLTTLYHSITTIAYSLIAALALVRVFNITSDNTGRYWKFPETAIMRRIGTDVPFITGYACMGTALLAQAGVQDLTSLMFSFTILFVTGFLQHISNVCKLMYDSLCKHTSGKTMEKLFKNENETGTYVAATLQFFGWSRLFMFVTIGLCTLSYMTMTREVVETNHVQTFTNGQIFYFALAFFWSNIGYDVVRELIPFTFERVHMDHSKILITGLYLLYYNLNMYWFAKQIESSGDINEFSLHGALTM